MTYVYNYAVIYNYTSMCMFTHIYMYIYVYILNNIYLCSLCVLKILTVETDYEEYDPFSILDLDPSASMSEIRKQYRRLSKIFHPDKEGGDQAMFMKIAKAYEA